MLRYFHSNMSYSSYISLTLIRHGKDFGAEMGKFDPEASLTPDGIFQTQKMVEYLRMQKITQIYSSPLKRTREAAEIIGKSIGLSPNYVNELSERDPGDASGMTFEQVKRKFNHLIGDNMFHKDWRFPGGESNGEVYKRTNLFLKELFRRTQGTSEHIVIISHAAPLNYMMNQLLGISFQEGLLFNFEPGYIAAFEQQKGYFQLLRFGSI